MDTTQEARREEATHCGDCWDGTGCDGGVGCGADYDAVDTDADDPVDTDEDDAVYPAADGTVSAGAGDAGAEPESEWGVPGDYAADAGDESEPDHPGRPDGSEHYQSGCAACADECAFGFAADVPGGDDAGESAPGPWDEAGAARDADAGDE